MALSPILVDRQKSRPPSLTEEEIQLKPSADLIADEYERTSNANVSVHILHFNTDHDQKNCKNMVSTLTDLGFKIHEKNLHDIEEENYLQVIEEVKKQSKGSDGLILLYSGFYKSENNLLFYENNQEVQINAKDIWTQFTSKKCPWLSNKPKIFLFQATKYGVQIQMDSRGRSSKMFTYESAYGAPAEADIVIVYNKTDGLAGVSDSTEFISQVCSNIEMFGKSEDILSLVTCTHCDYFATRPLLISTLTKKFYFTLSPHRGHHLNIQENHDEVFGYLKELHDVLANYAEKQGNKEKKNGILSRFSSSFRSGKDKNKIKEKYESTAKHDNSNGTSTTQVVKETIQNKPKTTENLPTKTSDNIPLKTSTDGVEAHLNPTSSTNTKVVSGSSAHSNNIGTSSTIRTRKPSTSSLSTKPGNRKMSISDVEIVGGGSLRKKQGDKDKKPIPWR